MAITIRPYNENDLDSCVELIQCELDPSFTRQRFEWQHAKNPMAPSFVVVAEHQSRIVGCYATIKKQVSVNGQIYIGARGVDSVVHPDFRGKGIFIKLLNYSFEHNSGIDFHLNFASNLSLPGFVKAGWSIIGSVPECFYQISYNKLLSKDFISWCLCKMKSLTNRVNKETAGSAILSPDFSNLSPDSVPGIAVIRSAAYLDWRYLENPVKQYTFLTETDAGKGDDLIVGYHHQKTNTFYVTDFLTSTAYDHFSLLWAINYCKMNRISALRTWKSCPMPIRKQMIYNPLNRYGGIKVLVKKCPESKVPDDIFNLTNWTITPGDLECF